MQTAQFEAATEKNIQETVEAERKAPRALSEECRKVHDQGLERRLADNFQQAVNQAKAVAAEELAEARAEWESRAEVTAASNVGVVFPLKEFRSRSLLWEEVL